MGGRLFDWLGGGVATSRPAAAGMAALLVSPGSTAFYFATDTKILSVYDDSGPAWFDIDMTALSALTNESIQDMIAAFFVNGSGISLSYNDAGNQLTIASTVTQYTDEMAQDAIAALIAAGTAAGLTIVYDDAGNALSLRNSRFMIPFFFTTTPTADELLCKYIATDAFTLAANFAGSKGVIDTNPTATLVITVSRQVNATGAFTTIGTISISTGGVFTFATSGGVSVSIAANDVLNFTAQHTPDTTAAGAAINVRGS